MRKSSTLILAACAILAVLSSQRTDAQSVQISPVSAVLSASPTATIPSPGASGSTYYLNASTGSDANNGLFPTPQPSGTNGPYKTITHANLSITPTSVVVIYPGAPYNESACLSVSGTISNYTTWIAAPGQARPLVAGNVLNYCFGSLEVINAAYVRVSGLAVTCPTAESTFGDGINVETAHHVRLDNDLVFNCPGGGIVADNSDYLTLQNSTLYGNANLNPDQGSGFSDFEPSPAPSGAATSNPYDCGTGAAYNNYICNNMSFENANLVKWTGYTFTTDGEGFIFDTFSAHGYTGTTLAMGNLAFGNGGRGLEVFQSNNVDLVGNSTFNDFWDTQQNGYPENGSEIDVYGSTNVNVLNNAVSALDSSHNCFYDYGNTNVTWSRNVCGVGTVTGSISGTTNKLASHPGWYKPSTLPAYADFDLTPNSPAVGYGQTLSWTFTDMSGTAHAPGSTLNAGAYPVTNAAALCIGTCL